MRFRLHSRERSIVAVPKPALALLLIALLMQIALHSLRQPPQALAAALPSPPSQEVLRLGALGDPTVAAKVLMLWLQAYDNPPGISIPFRSLDYSRVIAWLKAILRLDERAGYPLLAAARLYGEVPVPEKQRQMLDFVYSEFSKDPNHRWPWLAHAVYIARHRLHDMQLALQYSNALAKQVSDPLAPAWVKQMNIFVLEDMGEIEAAKVLLGGLLTSGQITDPAEQRFLTQRLEELQAKQH
jgi:hypothetical protein